MSRFRKLSHTIWPCQYHIIWAPKYRFKVLMGKIARDVECCIRTFAEYQQCEVVELNVRHDHVHLIAMIPPKLSISKFVGNLKGKSAIRILNKHKHLKGKPYWGNHFWSRGYCVDTVGLDADMVKKYVKFQEDKDRKAE